MRRVISLDSKVPLLSLSQASKTALTAFLRSYSEQLMVILINIIKNNNQILLTNYISIYFLYIHSYFQNFKKMGAQNSKQSPTQSSVQIDHPKFDNAKVYQQKNQVYMQTLIGVQQKDFNKWKQTISNVKSQPDHLLLPKMYDFATKGLCGSTGTLNISYDYYPYLLIQQIQNRKRRKSKFQECELWFLLYSLSAAQIQMKKTFDSKVGDIRPQNIFINQQGEIKVACLQSWPKQISNFQKTFEHQSTLLSPEQMKRLQLGGMDDPKNIQSQMFSIGMTILSTALLTDFSHLYDVTKFKFKYDEAKECLTKWRTNKVYSEIFIAFVSNLCLFESQKRLTEKELWTWIDKYEEQIKNKDDFVIEHAPLKIQKEIQQLRGTIISSQQVPLQQRSVVYPFIQRPTQNIVLPPTQNIPKNIVYNNNNIHPAQSMYTQVPQDLYQRQFSNYTQGAYSVKNTPVHTAQRVQREFLPPGVLVQNPPSNLGNFVYTRRIIDPNSGGIVAEERIGEDEYQRGVQGSARTLQKLSEDHY